MFTTYVYYTVPFTYMFVCFSAQTALHTNVHHNESSVQFRVVSDNHQPWTTAEAPLGHSAVKCHSAPAALVLKGQLLHVLQQLTDGMDTGVE